MEHFIDAFRHYADFKGRATRQQFWMFVLFYLIIAIVLNIVDALIGLPLLSTIFSLAMLIPSWAYGARRLHDTGRSGWWQLIILVPVLGFILLIVFWAQASHGDNQYGSAPDHLGGAAAV